MGIRPSATPGDQHVCVTTCPNNQWQSVPHEFGGLSFIIPPYYTAWAYGPQPPLGINMSALQHVQTPSGKAPPHEIGGVISNPPILYCMGIRPPATPGAQHVCVTTCPNTQWQSIPP